MFIGQQSSKDDVVGVSKGGVCVEEMPFWHLAVLKYCKVKASIYSFFSINITEHLTQAVIFLGAWKISVN